MRTGSRAASTFRRGPSKLDARYGLIGALVIAAANFLWQLGSSSYFQDEAFTIEHSTGTVGAVIHNVSTTEVTPWPYFVFIHEWLRAVSSTTEWLVRLPSAVAAIALVAASYWLARAFLRSAQASLVALLVAMSPLVLEYAQQARVYAFAMLAVTVAVAAVLHGVRDDRRQAALLTLGCVAAVAGLWLHYTAAAVIVPLCVWLIFQRSLTVRARVLFVGACLLALVADIPLFAFQHSHAPPGVFPGGTGLKVISVLETPFDGRFSAGLDVVRIVAAVVVVIAVGVVAWRATSRGEDAGLPVGLLVAVAGVAPIAILFLGAVGQDVMISRYTAVAAPAILTCVVVAAASLPSRLGLVLLVVAVVVSVIGLIQSHQASGIYPPTKAVVQYVRGRDRADEPVLFSAAPDPALTFYASRFLPAADLSPLSSNPVPLTQAVKARERIWIIDELGSTDVAPGRLARLVNSTLGALRYHVVAVREFRTSSTIAAYLVGPGS